MLCVDVLTVGHVKKKMEKKTCRLMDIDEGTLKLPNPVYLYIYCVYSIVHLCGGLCVQYRT